MSNTGIIVGVGILAAGGGLAYYLYTKNKATSTLIDSTSSTTTTTNQVAPASGGSSLPAAAATAPAVAQTLWKDAEGHVFQLTNQQDKYGYLLKVDGGGSAKAVSVNLDSSNHIVIQNAQGENWTFKDNKWNRLSGLKGLRGAPIPMVRPMKLGNAYALNG